MNRIAGMALVMLLALQGGLPSIGLEPPISNLATLAISVVIAGLSFLQPAPNQGS